MLTLSATLLSAQKSGNMPPLCKIVLSRNSQTTRGYDTSRIVDINFTEEDDNRTTDVLLDNSDNALAGLDFEQYQGVISLGYHTGVARSAWQANHAYVADDIVVPTTANGYQYRCTVAGNSHATTEPTWGTALGVTQTDNTVPWEMDGYSGDEYQKRAPLKQNSQNMQLTSQALVLALHLVGIANQMSQDKAKAEYSQESTDTNTYKTLISAVCAAGTGLSSAFNGYTAFTATYDSEDSIIDTYAPKDYFHVSVNENRWDKFAELIDDTGCKVREGVDGNLHVLDPVTTGTTYAYEYKYNVSGEHPFFGKDVRNRFVNPNQEIVKSHPDQGSYTGTATSATSYALSPKTHTTFMRLASDAQAAAIAAAIIERYELSAERGSIGVPVNVGQELWDYIKVTDSFQGDTRIGNVQYINFRFNNPRTGAPATFQMTLGFGKLALRGLGGLGLLSGIQTDGASTRNADMIAMLIEKYGSLLDYLNKLADAYISLQEAHNALVDDFNTRWASLITDELTLKKLTVTEQMIIPEWS